MHKRQRSDKAAKLVVLQIGVHAGGRWSGLWVGALRIPGTYRPCCPRWTGLQAPLGRPAVDSEFRDRAGSWSPAGFRRAPGPPTSLPARRGALQSMEWHHGPSVLRCFFNAVSLREQALDGQTLKKHRSFRCDAILLCGE